MDHICGILVAPWPFPRGLSKKIPKKWRLQPGINPLYSKNLKGLNDIAHLTRGIQSLLWPHYRKIQTTRCYHGKIYDVDDVEEEAYQDHLRR